MCCHRLPDFLLLSSCPVTLLFPCHVHVLPGLRLLVPAYWFPTTTSSTTSSSCSHPDYLRLAQAGSMVAAIANPYNGPVSPDPTSALYSPNFPEHHACIQALYDAGAAPVVATTWPGNQVFGYVSTKLATETSPGVWLQTGFRPLAEVQADLLAWNTHFNLTGIFLDEVSNLWQVVGVGGRWPGD